MASPREIVKDSKQVSNTDKGMHSRRKFMKKAALGSLVLTVPAKPVWGACSVSGAVSGNASRVNQDCVFLNLTNGRSPGFWRASGAEPFATCGKGSSGGKNDKKNLASAFPYLQAYKPKGKESDSLFVCEMNKLRARITDEVNNAVVVVGHDVNGNVVELNIKVALSECGGLAWNLAAIYLNAVFGFYDNIGLWGTMLDSGDLIENADDLIAHYYGLSMVHGLNDSDFGFTDGVTSFSLEASCST